MKNKYIYVFVLCFTLLSQTTKAFWTKTGPGSTFLTSIETSPWGILVGEFDTRIWLNPPPANAVYFSPDLGQSWKVIGLNGRAITDLKFYDGKIYAATYYVKDGISGLFVSDDLGNTWKQTGPSFTLSKVNRDSKTIYSGGDNRGLWVSYDDGATWVQKLGENQYGPNIKAIESFENITFVSTIDKTYKTTDHGLTWEEVAFLSGKGIVHFSNPNGSILFAGSSGTSGLYKSSDFGNSWNKVNSFGNYAVGDLISYDGKLYAGKLNPDLFDTYTVLESSDLGNTWTDTNLNVPSAKRVLDMTWVFSDPVNIYALSLNNGVFKYDIPKYVPASLPMLDIPWRFSYQGELTDKITSFFDHEYPLLGYELQKESPDKSSTTLNFLGNREQIPSMYYSSHNGIDYSLSYGDEVLAAESGIASYYYCADCGNSIRITHPNGYQSIYMHLQKSDLITLDQDKIVQSGDVIGKIGMTGNTNGPHLHFEVLKNGVYPDGLSDPYGWHSPVASDPWPLLEWTDSLGYHRGTGSVNLWKNFTTETSELITGSGSVSLENKTVTWGETSTNSKTVFLKNSFRPVTSYVQKFLSYVPNTSLSVNAYDFLGNEITSFSEPVFIKIGFLENSLLGINKQSLKIYYFNKENNLWEPLPTILDLVTNMATATTYHFSEIAMFGQKIDNNAPFTQANVNGLEEGGWYSEYPVVGLQSVDPESSQTTIFYSIGGESDWNEYTGPFTTNKEGIVNLEYRSMDEFNNLEETKNMILKINTTGAKTKLLKIKNAIFTVE